MIGENGNDELFLECRISNDEIFRFYIQYSADLASGADLQTNVSYSNGWVTFTEPNQILVDIDSETEDDFYLLMPIKDTDYFIPMVEDIEECPVCYELFEPMYASNCGHCICVECMQKMDTNNLSACPMCRSAKFKYPIAIACNRSFVRC